MYDEGGKVNGAKGGVAGPNGGVASPSLTVHCFSLLCLI